MIATGCQVDPLLIWNNALQNLNVPQVSQAQGQKMLIHDHIFNIFGVKAECMFTVMQCKLGFVVGLWGCGVVGLVVGQKK